jgi:hypothetical protein
MIRCRTRWMIGVLALGLSGCGGGDRGVGGESAGPGTAGTDASLATPGQSQGQSQAQEAFFARLEALCGRAFRGEATLTSSDGFDGEMIMHVRRCTPEEIQIPLHIGENRSRTWIVTRTATGLRLKHDHRLPDGSDDPVTQYGGDTRDGGTPESQSFAADAFTAELIPDAVTNVWSMTFEEGDGFVYHLSRHGAPRATFAFDLTDEVDPPPAPWGYEGT